MNALQVDPASGFLTADNDCTFDAHSKVRFLELARECVKKDAYPRISNLCKAVGIYPQTFYNHIQQDREFKRQWEAVMIEIEELLSESLVRNAQRANGVGAAAFWLKNRVPERWSDNPGSTIQINDFSWLKKLHDAFNPSVVATEAEITSNKKSIDSPP